MSEMSITAVIYIALYFSVLPTISFERNPNFNWGAFSHAEHLLHTYYLFTHIHHYIYGAHVYTTGRIKAIRNKINHPNIETAAKYFEGGFSKMGSFE